MEKTNQIEGKYLWPIIVVSLAVPALVAYLIYEPQTISAHGNWVYLLPHLNAALNGTTSLLLIAGWYFIRKKQISNHRNMMVSAFVLGALFLVSYVLYHGSAPSTSFGGEGLIRSIYYFVLLSHIILAAVVVPLVLIALYFALSDRIVQHKKIVRYAYPIWLYVSITGVVVYLMIRPYYAF